MQRFLYERIVAALYHDSIPLLLKRRWSVLRPDALISSVDFSCLKQFLAKLSPAWSTSILKTWANAWTTSYRLHEPFLCTCVFGCRGEPDALQHYLRCPQLWRHLSPISRTNLISAPAGAAANTAASAAAASNVISISNTSGAIDFPISRRLLLVEPTFVSALNLVAAFLSYNSVRHDTQSFCDRPESIIDAALAHARCTANRVTSAELPPPTPSTHPPANRRTNTDLSSDPDAPSPPIPFAQPPFWYEHICVSCDVARSIGCECFMCVHRVIRVSNPIPPPSEQRHDIIPPPHPHAPHNDTITLQASSSAACAELNNPPETWEDFFADSEFAQRANDG